MEGYPSLDIYSARNEAQFNDSFFFDNWASKEQNCPYKHVASILRPRLLLAETVNLSIPIKLEQKQKTAMPIVKRGARVPLLSVSYIHNKYNCCL